jgi:predicted dehydrogenase
MKDFGEASRMSQVRLGVIGTGRMGLNHCRVISSIHAARLIGVHDVDLECSRRAADLYGGRPFADLQELLDEVDAVTVATPTSTHLPIGRLCLDQGKHILIEKPLAENPENAQIIVEIASESDCCLQVGHIERFNPAYRELKVMLEEMPLISVDFRRLSPFPGSNTDVDVVYDLMVHDIDLMMNLVGKHPSAFFASGLSAFTGQIDHASVLVEYEGGPLVTLSASRLTEEKVRRVEVTTSNAFIVADLLDKKVSINRRTIGEYLNFNAKSVKYRHESLVERIHVPPLEPLLLQMQAFITCIQKNESPQVTGMNGWETITFAQQIKEEIEERLLIANHVKETV